MPSIDTLVEDVQDLLLNGKEVTAEDMAILDTMMLTMRKAVINSFSKKQSTLRLSNIGRSERALWYELNGFERDEPDTPEMKLKYLYGDVIEALLLALCEMSGHTVERRQEEVVLAGVKGHIDAIIDGTVVDIKSASPASFEKFKEGTLANDDPFGYICQLSAYSKATGIEPAYFLVMDKTLGKLCLSELSVNGRPDCEKRIEHLKEVISKPEPPQSFCSVKVEDNGNVRLVPPCSYCNFKHRCNPDLRTFIYSTGPRFYTHIESLPRVPEATKEKKTES